MKWGIVLLMMLAASVSAQESGQWSFGLVASKHANDDNSVSNERHGMIEYHHHESGLMGALITENSYGDTALTVGKAFQFAPLWGIVEPEVYIGAVYGYKDNIKYSFFEKISPYGWLGLNVDTPIKGLTAKIRAVPEIWTVGIYYGF